MSETTFSKSLKARNLPWLCSLIALDAILLMVQAFPAAVESVSLTQMTVTRTVVTIFLPVVILLLSGLVSPNIKAMLVYWKIKDPLPAAEAFSKHAPADVRIDLASLRKNIGAFPTDPREQNTLWYKLYTKVRAEPGVIESHKSYLLFREMATVSLLLLMTVPFGFAIIAAGATAAWIAVFVFLVQYVLAAIAARNSGMRFVTNVLAVHSTRKVSSRKSATQPSK